MNKQVGSLMVALSILSGAAGAQADIVTDWNAIMQATVTPVNPFLQTRSAAITQLAVFEAVNAILGDYESYLGVINAPAGASPEAAAIAAAHHALVSLHPASTALLDGYRNDALSQIPDGQNKNDGIDVGILAANALLLLRANDGHDAVVPYTPGTEPGDWQPTPPAFAPAFLAGWGQVIPFGLQDGAQFRPSPPPAIHTGKYAKDYQDVMLVGAANSPVRPQDRTDVARFYASLSPVIVWNDAARQASVAQGKTLSENARDFALLAIALHDGLMSSMEAKFFYQLWRPVTAIRAGDTDGNHKTDADANWLPLVTTPPYPTFPSNYASSSGGARMILEKAYGKSGHAVTLTSSTMPPIVLNYTAWEQITDDINDARVYGGIHFWFDQEAGARQGEKVGKYVLHNYLRPAHNNNP